jgi:hypothetical protein
MRYTAAKPIFYGSTISFSSIIRSLVIVTLSGFVEN